MPEVFLIDASIYIHRAWCVVSPELADHDGKPVNALMGFSEFLVRLLRRNKPSSIMLAFDGRKCFRHRLHPAYKSNRPAKDPNLVGQISLCRDLAEALGLCCLSHEDYEADDVIGTVGRLHRNEGFVCQYVSRDKDLAQLVRPGDYWWGAQGDGRVSYEGIQEKFGVYPEQIADYLALVGDTVDTIPGVPGIGKVTATRLLGRHQNAEQVIRSGQLNDTQIDIVRHCLRLTQIVCEVPLPPQVFTNCRRGPVAEERLSALAQRMSLVANPLPTWLASAR